ncbi:MAG: hypothetical protein LBR27_02660 [Bifidobacteriaceae bacterium]|jgi:histidinol-phosphate/aromatic aminotransferase/cobyric acid decarboxylase-like protein|nr:hypothetical protein [Bifidobacteriaceae bacterium]
MVFARRDGVPGEVLGRLGLARGAKVLAAAWLERPSVWLIATQEDLVVAGGEADKEADESIPWTDIERAKIGRDTGSVTLLFVDPARAPRRFVVPPTGKRLTKVIDEQIRSSVLAVQFVPMPGGPARVALRRPIHGEPFVQVILPKGVPELDGEARAAVDAAVASLREAAGLPA